MPEHDIRPDPDTMARLEHAVACLPRRQRDVFLAHRLDGLSYGEIASLSGLSRHTVQSLMARALFNIDRQMCGYRLRWWELIW